MNSGLQLSQYCPFERDKFKIMILNYIKHFYWEELCWIHEQVFHLSKENVHTLISHRIHSGTIIRSIRTNINCKVAINIKCELCSPTLGIWDERQVKVILDLWHKCYLEVKENGVILKMSMTKNKILINLLHREFRVYIIDYTSEFAV